MRPGGKTHSFRLRIALLSSAISGLTLLALGAFFWQLSDRMDLARIDRELRNLGNPQLDRVNGPSHWERFEAALRFVAGSERQSPYILWVREEGRELHRSRNWPSDIQAKHLPTLGEYPVSYGLAPDYRPVPPRRGEPITPANPALPLKSPRFVTLRAAGRSWRVGVLGNGFTTLALGADLGQLNAATAELRRAYLTALPLALLLVGGGAWLLAARALQPIEMLTHAAERVTVRGLDQRIPALAQDHEIQRLITVYNQMMDRLEASFHQATRFSADAAHELKTPLTILQGELELALQASEPGSDLQRLFGRLIDEIARLRSITDKLLLLAQADAGTLLLHRQVVDLSQEVLEAMEDLTVLAPGVTVDAHLVPDIHVQGDPHLLAQLVQNLTTNAVRYNSPTGRVALSLELDAKRDMVRLQVSNSGPGIPPADQERIFNRFQRADAARSREHGGVGLGLSLSREIARAHGGDLTLESSTENETTFLLLLPADLPQLISS